MIITTATTATTATLMMDNVFEGGIFLVALLIVLLSLKEILDSDKKFLSFTPKINTLLFPLVFAFSIIVAQNIIKIV